MRHPLKPGPNGGMKEGVRQERKSKNGASMSLTQFKIQTIVPSPQAGSYRAKDSRQPSKEANYFQLHRYLEEPMIYAALHGTLS